MDVKCERCNTEYEFDDALVSGRGTTVKCTNCGHKFKIRREEGDFSEDFWNVTTDDGRTLVFTSLRELQHAIQGHLVGRHDRLSRGGLPPKAIGQIPELAPFFDPREAAQKRSPAGQAAKTYDGLGPPDARASSAPPPPRTRERQATKPDFLAPPPEGSPGGGELVGTATLIGTGPLASAPAIPVAVPPPTPAASAPLATSRPSTPPPPEPLSLPRGSVDTVPLERPAPAASLAAPPSSAPAVPPPVAPAPVTDISSSLPSRVERSLFDEIGEDHARRRGSSSSVPVVSRARRGVGGFVVAAVVVGCVLLLGAMWARKNLGATLGGKPPAPLPAADPRVATFLSSGEKALAEGDLELAKESFDKASALSERDPRVLVGVARLAAVRADVPWLTSRLLPADAVDEHRVARDGLNDLAAAARRAADEALLVAPDDPAALRAKIDAARISGDRDGARALVAKIASSSAQRALDPETAYVLAALDLAEAEPLWSTVLERLKVASSVETGPGRARAALVYVLARSGDASGAKAEVERLVGMTRAHPLLPLLRAFADRAAPEAKLDAGSPTVAAATDAPDAGKAVRGRGAGGGVRSDARELVAQGERARAKGDYERARTLFTAAVEKNPRDSEALAGLAALAYAQHDLPGASAAYKRVLAINPNYMPAVVGLADVAWDSGDKTAATKMYKDIVDRYPEGAYPGRVKVRAEGGG